MRSEQEMFKLIVDTAEQDERIRAVILNGSRANPNAPADPFQDFDIVYVVTDLEAFRHNLAWIQRFGELMILQLPDEMREPPAGSEGAFTFLMQFMDGNRIDLRIYPLARLPELEKDSLSRLLLDKDGVIGPLASASEGDYLPDPPTAKAFADCCNEFWWVCPYVAKGLWREEIIYARSMLDQVVREQLMQMLTWYIGVKTGFSKNPGKLGKYFQQYLEPDLWDRLLKTYAEADDAHTWEALHRMCDLFRLTGRQVAEHFGFDYPDLEDDRVQAHLKHVQGLPRHSKEIY